MPVSNIQASGRLPLALALQMELEERELDLLAIELGGLGVERDVAQRRAVAAAPAAVDPGTHHDRVRRAGARLLDAAIRLQRAEQVLGVEPAADGQHGRPDVLQMRPQVARLPELVVGAVPHHLVPERDLPLEVFGVGVVQRAQFEEEL